jgi:NAD(P)-dependent dehydrogenase (short-subunit alcohol dehydrogenase family)
MDKVVLITGGSRGIGAAAARGAGRDGYRVVINYTKRGEDAAQVVRDIKQAGGEAIAIQADMGSEADIQRLFAEVDKQFGRLDGLVNNAGIVNISSGAATLGSPGEFIHYAASKGAINTMTLGLAKELAREGIRVNAIEPGMIDTEMQTASGDLGRMARIVPTVPMARAGLADEVAAPILFLLSDASSYMTGAVLRVAGGR